MNENVAAEAVNVGGYRLPAHLSQVIVIIAQLPGSKHTQTCQNFQFQTGLHASLRREPSATMSCSRSSANHAEDLQNYLQNPQHCSEVVGGLDGRLVDVAPYPRGLESIYHSSAC